MKPKYYTITKKKTDKEKLSFKITIDQKKIPNKAHLESQQKYKSQIFDDRRKRDPKHKNKLTNESY